MRKKLVLLCIFLGLFATSCSNSKVVDQSEKDGMAALERVREKIKEEDKIKAEQLREEQKMKEEQLKAEQKLKEEEKIQEEEQVEKEEQALKQAQEQLKKAEIAQEGNVSISPEDAVNEYLKEKKKQEKENRKKPQTEIEKLKETQKLANEKLDFYERVVRSVAREEQDILKHKENMSVVK